MLWSEKFHLIFIQELYASMQLLSHFKVSIHPSHSVMIPNLGEDEAEILGQVKSHFLIFLQSACLSSFPSLLFMAWSRLKALNLSCQPWLIQTMWSQGAWRRLSWLKRSLFLTNSPYHHAPHNPRAWRFPLCPSWPWIMGSSPAETWRIQTLPLRFRIFTPIVSQK